MADTDFYTLANVKAYLGIDDSDDDTDLDRYGTNATKNTQNFLQSIYGDGNIPTAAAGTVTDDMKERTDYLVCKLFKGQIKEYKARDHFKDLVKMSEENIRLEAKSKPRSSSKVSSYAQDYRTSPMTERND